MGVGWNAEGGSLDMCWPHLAFCQCVCVFDAVPKYKLLSPVIFLMSLSHCQSRTQSCRERIQHGCACVGSPMCTHQCAWMLFWPCGSVGAVTNMDAPPHMHMCHANVPMRLRLRACMRAHPCGRARAGAPNCMQADASMRMRPFGCTHVHACGGTHAYAPMRVQLCARMHADTPMRMRTFGYASVHACGRTHLDAPM
eukprot:354922-Chlamydomonas_euryale.AAC.15